LTNTEAKKNYKIKKYSENKRGLRPAFISTEIPMGYMNRQYNVEPTHSTYMEAKIIQNKIRMISTQALTQFTSMFECYFFPSKDQSSELKNALARYNLS
jgi:hypothetical protein